MFTGSLVALVTPFKNGEVDYKKQKELVEFHIKKWNKRDRSLWYNGRISHPVV